MNKNLQDFIVERLGELARAEEPLQRQLQAIYDERRQLMKAAGAAGIDANIQAEALPQKILLQVERRTIPEKTIKEAVLEVLKDRGTGMTALEILAAINLKFRMDYPRTSLSPQLSRLKAAGMIEREGTVWQLSQKMPWQTDIEDALK